jgi:hypothetical protein
VLFILALKAGDLMRYKVCNVIFTVQTVDEEKHQKPVIRKLIQKVTVHALYRIESPACNTEMKGIIRSALSRIEQNCWRA